MNWRDETVLELTRAKEAQRSGNQGMVRASARRAAGIAISELQQRFPEKQYGRDFMEQLRSFAGDEAIPTAARAAADRLQTRISPDFESPSKHPIEDARIIIDFVIHRLS
jgi:hypothetical protein